MLERIKDYKWFLSGFIVALFCQMLDGQFVHPDGIMLSAMLIQVT